MARNCFAGLLETDDDKKPPKDTSNTGETLSISGGFGMA